MHRSEKEHWFWNKIRESRIVRDRREEIEMEIREAFSHPCVIMWTDLVGFSRATEKFGIFHFLRIIEEMEEVVAPLINRHAGRIIKLEGDSYLVLFSQLMNAISCAKKINRVLSKRNIGRAEEDRIEICIGIGLGDILDVDSHDAWGAEINYTNKLGEERAREGEILLTSPAAERARKNRRVKLEARPGIPGTAIRDHFALLY